MESKNENQSKKILEKDVTYEQFWNTQAKPLWDAYKTDLRNNVKMAEKYLEDILKLIITLSTGLLAFMVASQDKIIKNMLPQEAKLLLLGFMLAIIFAMLSFVSLSINYKQDADSDDASLKDLYRKLKGQRIEEIKDKIEKDGEDFLSKGSEDGWQRSTIGFAIVSFFAFIFSTFMLIYILIQSTIK